MGGRIRRSTAAACASVVIMGTTFVLQVAVAPPAGATISVLGTQRATVSSTGGQLTNPNSGLGPVQSRDGRFVGFISDESDIVPGDTNGVADGYAYDTLTRTTSRVTLGNGDIQPDSASYLEALSGTGRYAVFVTKADNLDTHDAPNAFDVFVRDRDTDNDGIFDEPGATSTVLISRPATPGTVLGTRANGASGDPTGSGNNVRVADISANGRYVAFQSFATNLVPGGSGNFFGDAYIHDRDADGNGVFDEPTGQRNIVVSKSNDGSTDGPAYHARISADGRFVVFSSQNRLAANDTNNANDIYVRDRDTDRNGVFDEAGGTSTSLVTVATNGTQLAPTGGLQGSDFGLSDNGRYVVFDTNDPQIAPDGPLNNDVVLRDRDTDGDGIFDEPGAATTTLVSNAPAVLPEISGDGRSITYVLEAGGLFERGPDGVTRRVDVASDGTAADHNAQEGFPSTDGTRVAYGSAATNLVSDDTNGKIDLFVTTIAETPLSLTATLGASTATTPPGATRVRISDIPTETIKGLDLDVSTAPTGVKFKPTGVKFKPTGVKFKPTGVKFKPVGRATLASFASRLRLATAARAVPLNDVPIDYPGGWPALLVGTPYQGVPTQSLSFGTILDLLTGIPSALPADHPLQTLTVGDLGLDDGPLSTISPAGLLLGATPVEQLHFADGNDWCAELASLSANATTCASLGVGSSETMMELDLEAGASAALATYPDLRRPPLAANLSALAAADAPVLDARLGELGLSVTRLGDLPLSQAIVAVPGLASITVASLPTPIKSALVACGTSGFDCSTGTLGGALTAAALAPAATLADLGPGAGDVTVGSLPASLLGSIGLNDVATGYLDASDFPWEDVDLTTAGLQRFAEDPAIVHYRLTLQPSGNAGPFTAKASVDLPAGFRLMPGTSTVTSGATLTAPVEQVTSTSTTVSWSVGGVAADTPTVLEFDVVPGLQLGTFAAHAAATIGKVTATGAPQPIAVAETSDAGSTPATATPVQADTLYLGYVPTGGDVDLYQFSPSAGADVGVRLSHLAGDADLVLYGPRTDAAGSGPSALVSRAVGPAITPTADTGDDSDSFLANGTPPLGDDVAKISGQTVVGSSTSDASSDQEFAAAPAANLIEVSSYDTAHSNLPYVLHVRESFPTPAPACPPYVRSGGTAGTLPDLTALPADLNTLVLTNQQRLGDTFGSDGTALMGKLQDLASAPGVTGAVLPLEGDTSIASAYDAWNANPCDSDLANAVVDGITALVDGIRKGTLPGVSPHPGLKYVVIAGGDDIVPMARLADTTRIGNESGYADTFDAGTEYYGALASEHFLSDDPYGDLDPIPWLNRRLYVPDLAVGRLVESPSDITTMIDDYVASNGQLNASKAFVSGYDFMTAGANAVDSALNQSLTSASGGTHPTITSRISNSWTASDLLNAVHNAAPDVTYLNGHAFHGGELSAAGLSSGTGEQFSAPDFAAQLPTGSRLVFSMGCHAGLNVSDAVVNGGPLAPDFAQELNGRGSVFVGVTGYGLGDDSGVQLHDRLMLLLAKQLDGAVSLGQAMTNAKQEYFATEGIYGAYDDKVISSTELYGLPMFTIGGASVTRPTPVDTNPTPSAGGLSSAPFSFDPTFTAKSSPDGGWFEVDNPAGGTYLPQATPGYPIEPRLDGDVTATSGGGTLLPAHGALVTAITEAPPHGHFDAAWSQVTLDSSSTSPEAPSGELAFPDRFATITTHTDANGYMTAGAGAPQRQNLVVMPGRFETDPTPGPNGVGTQQLFSHIAGSVIYSASADYDPPAITTSTGSITGTTAHFTVHASDVSAISRVVVLYDDSSGWHSVDLSGSGGAFSGAVAVPTGTTDVQFFTQVIDGAGNIAVSSGKGHLDDAVTAPKISISGASVAEPHVGSVNATLTVSLSHSTVVPVTVNYATSDGTANAGADYVATDGVAEIEAGQTSTTIAVPVLADDVSETSESFAVSLSDPSGATVGTSSATVTIADTFAPPTISVGNVSVVEGNTGTRLVRLPVVLSKPATTSVTVKYLTTNGTATAPADYRAIKHLRTLTIKPGHVAAAIAMTVKADTVVEPDETLTVDLSAPTNAVLANAHGIVTIVDDDSGGPNPSPTVSVGDTAVREGDSGIGTELFTISLDRVAASAVTVSYLTHDGTAKARVDYKPVANPATATIAAGQSSVTVKVRIYADTVVEGDETFTLTLSDPSAGTVLDAAHSTGTATILNDD